MKPIILIPARMASTRLPGKPLADIHGKPMILHVWQRAVAANSGRVVVATDTADIADVIHKAGGEAVLTRAGHASGSDRIFEALQKVDAEGKHDVVINLQGDMPTLDPAVIPAVLEPLADPKTDIATLAAQITDEVEIHDPAVVKVTLGIRDWGSGINGNEFLNPQHLVPNPPSFSRTAKGPAPYYHHIGIYAYRRAALERFVALPPSAGELQERLEQLRALENGMKIGVKVVDTVPLGVDTPETLEKARKALA